MFFVLSFRLQAQFDIVFGVWLRWHPIGRKGATDQIVNYCHQVDSVQTTKLSSLRHTINVR